MQGKCFNINYKMNLWHKLLSYAFYNYNNCFVDSKTNRTFKQMLKKIKYHYLAMSEKNSWILLKLKVYFSPSGK